MKLLSMNVKNDKEKVMHNITFKKVSVGNSCGTHTGFENQIFSFGSKRPVT